MRCHLEGADTIYVNYRESEISEEREKIARGILKVQQNWVTGKKEQEEVLATTLTQLDASRQMQKVSEPLPCHNNRISVALLLNVPNTPRQ